MSKKKTIELCGMEFEVKDNDGFAEERNYFDENGNLIKTEADGGDKDIIETIYEYDEAGNNIKITSTIRPKIKLITPKSQTPPPNSSIVIELSYDDQNRLVKLSRNGMVAETWKYAKTGRITHMKYIDESFGLCEIKEVTDKNGELVFKTMTANGAELAKYSKNCIRGTWYITDEKRNPYEGSVSINKMKYRVEGNKQIIISKDDICSVPGFRTSTKLLEIRYNDNNDVEYMKVKESVNGTSDITERKFLYKNGKSYFIIDPKTGQEQLSNFTKNGYDVIKVLPSDISGMLSHLYEYDITKDLKKVRYSFNGTLRDMSFMIIHKDTKDEFQYCSSRQGTNEAGISIHVVKDNIVYDVLQNMEETIVTAQFRNKKGKVVNEIRFRSNDPKNEIYDKISTYLLRDYSEEITKFVGDAIKILQMERINMAKNNDKVEIDKSKVKSWREFSMNQQTENAIKKRILTEGIDSVCTSYICRFSRLSENFIEELRALSTGLLKPDDFYSENLKTILDGLDRRSMMTTNSYNKVDGEKLGKITLKYRDISGTTYSVEKAISGIRDRIDWTYISQYQVLSEEFILKHAKDVHWGFIFKSQNVSKEFRKKYGNQASTIDAPVESEENYV